MLRSAAAGGVQAGRSRLLVGAAFCSLIFVGVSCNAVFPGGVLALVQEARDFLRGAGMAGQVLFATLQLVALLSGAVPASLIGVAAGAIYGLVPGFAVAAAGCLLGALTAFALSRSFFRASIEAMLSRHGRLRALDDSLSRNGWKAVCLLRLSPVMPFTATSFLLGLSAVALPGYLLGTLACLPPLFAYVYLGTLADAGLSTVLGGGNPWRWVMLGVGCLATLLLLAQLGRLMLPCRMRGLAVEEDVCGR